MGLASKLQAAQAAAGMIAPMMGTAGGMHGAPSAPPYPAAGGAAPYPPAGVRCLSYVCFSCMHSC